VRRLGSAGPEVSALALGCMAMSGTYGPATDEESTATIHAALDAGINLLDTGDFYGMGHNELLIARALGTRNRDEVLISVKFGAQRGPDGSQLGFDARPAAVKTALSYTLNRLGVEHVDIYRPARLDPNVPIEETVGAISEMVQAGYVRYIGLSEVGGETIRRASSVHPICDLQIEYSVITRGIERSILPVCRELGVAITAYGVLSRGLLSGHYSPGAGTGGGDIRHRFPRFQGENLERNMKLAERVREIAKAKDATPAQVAIAWVLSRGDDVVPIPGTRRRTYLEQNAAAGEIELTSEDLAQLDELGEAAGDRYTDMSTVNR
jgi:aryl-alcohol dehydrogenase-like predicted oxidoreductase